MVSSRFALFVLSCLALTASACTQSAPVAVQHDDAATAPPSVSVAATETGFSGAVALFDVVVDPVALTAEATPVRTASAQPPQAIYYDLDIENFRNPDSFKLFGFFFNDDGDLVLDYSHAHPFPAPDFAFPITGINRADLGYTGRLVVIADDDSTSFINGEVTLMPDFLINPDGYVQPGDLLAIGNLNNDTFPYKLLVDEAFDNRLEASNGGDPEGNYGGAIGGWQRANIGAEGNGWTGFDYLHGGQTTLSQLIIGADQLNGSPLEFSVAILIKYTDPRGMGGRDLRFPPEVPVATEFAYRLPFAALDNSVIGPKEEWSIGAAPASTSDVELLIRDWDTRANEADDADLSDEQDVMLIQPDASGIPRVFLNVPALMNSSIQMTGLRGTGIPGDEMEFGGTLTNDLEPPIGTVYGVAKVIDNEDSLNRTSYHFGVDPVTVEPTRMPLDIVTYQVIPIRVGEAVPTIRSISPSGPLGQIGSEVTFSANVAGVPDSYYWVFGDGIIPSTSTDPSPTVLLNRTGLHFCTLRVSNADGTSNDFTVPYEIDGINEPPVFTETDTGIMDAISPKILFPEGNPAIIYAENTGLYEIKYAGASVPDPISADTGPFIAPAPGGSIAIWASTSNSWTPPFTTTRSPW